MFWRGWTPFVLLTAWKELLTKFVSVLAWSTYVSVCSTKSQAIRMTRSLYNQDTRKITLAWYLIISRPGEWRQRTPPWRPYGHIYMGDFLCPSIHLVKSSRCVFIFRRNMSWPPPPPPPLVCQPPYGGGGQSSFFCVSVDWVTQSPAVQIWSMGVDQSGITAAILELVI
jgi:hypothetical protein